MEQFFLLRYCIIHIETFCSEADLYIKEYLHPLVERGFNNARPLRIYYQYRWRGTVSTVVQRYCTFSEDRNDYPTFRSDKILRLKHLKILTGISHYIYNITSEHQIPVGLVELFYDPYICAQIVLRLIVALNNIKRLQNHIHVQNLIAV